MTFEADVFQAAHPPRAEPLSGVFARLEPLTPAHAPALFAALGQPQAADLWKHMRDGPFPTLASFEENIALKSDAADALFYAIIDIGRGAAAGHVALMRADAAHRVIEIGHVIFGPTLQRSRAATEAIYLLAKYVFEDLGYRRLEWKCDACNAPSVRAAMRFGFSFEGLFRQHMIVKGRNRNTAWFSMLDAEWPKRKAAFEAWLAPDNFDAAGRQIKPLAAWSPAPPPVLTQ